ncbi:Retrovirus-related Pol polyprotein from transposon TNT 1-94 [Vitis vinifera]|uniref:Retrovirus-related Pol polyprotein from transposon TNT 1-94 n=1 Tax=Vitis vinifera TaxID=29760 RepID=A0A438FT09_VITVI|nr:Retrovirus-related Pol polyprotein from transposon TNT 1-94 [Vitis vinifera]
MVPHPKTHNILPFLKGIITSPKSSRELNSDLPPVMCLEHPNKWVYQIKEEHDASKRYKARLVVKGFQQKKGIDYIVIFSLVVKLITIRTVLGLVAKEDLHLQQMDIKMTFFHGDLEEEIYMHQPQGFQI